jgi:hypothetical protein
MSQLIKRTAAQLIAELDRFYPSDAPERMRTLGSIGVRAMLDPEAFIRFMGDLMPRAFLYRGRSLPAELGSDPAPMNLILAALADEALARGYGEPSGRVFVELREAFGEDPSEFRRRLATGLLPLDRFFMRARGHGQYSHVLQMVYFMRRIDQETGQVGAGAEFLRYLFSHPRLMEYWVRVFDEPPIQNPQDSGLYQPIFVSEMVIQPLIPRGDQ